MIRIKIFEKLKIISRQKYYKYLYNTNKLRKLTILETLAPRNNILITRDLGGDHSTTISELSLHNGSIQDITIENFLILSGHLTDKTENLLRKILLYLFRNLILMTKTCLYFD